MGRSATLFCVLGVAELWGACDVDAMLSAYEKSNAFRLEGGSPAVPAEAETRLRLDAGPCRPAAADVRRAVGPTERLPILRDGHRLT